MDQIDKNTVEAKNQLKEDGTVSFVNPEGRGVRVLFVGNSITRHGVAPHIGWNQDWGMAASDISKDYVHILSSKISENDPEAAFCICQVWEWERNFANGENVLAKYERARDFQADIIIMRCIENCPRVDFDQTLFIKEYQKLLAYLNIQNCKKIIVTTGFWKHEGDVSLQKFAKENGYLYVYLGDLGELDEMKAIGLFEHGGVANHPGDLGMQTIAERIYQVIVDQCEEFV